MDQKHVIVLAGGKSLEREVSLRSGKAVADALAEGPFRVTLFDPAKRPLSEIETLRPDVAFIALHGIGGEDGSIQGLLEWLGIPYTGPGIAASALCLDKIMTKKVLTLSGVPTPEFLDFVWDEALDPEKSAEEAVRALGIPFVLKACRQGSSIGTEIVRKKEDAPAAFRALLAYKDNLLAEKFLSGAELTVPVMGNRGETVLPVIEIRADGEYYDYHSKYTPGKSRHIIPAAIPPEAERAAREVAQRAYLATGCRGYARVDMMLDEKGEVQVIEINTAPGMTATSLFPDAARAAGMDFPTLTRTLVELALK